MNKTADVMDIENGSAIFIAERRFDPADFKITGEALFSCDVTAVTIFDVTILLPLRNYYF